MLLIDKHSWNSFTFRNHNSHSRNSLYGTKWYRAVSFCGYDIEKTTIRTDKCPNHPICVIDIPCYVFVLRSWRFVWSDKTQSPSGTIKLLLKCCEYLHADYRCHTACQQKTWWRSEMGTRTLVRQRILTGIHRIQGSEHQEVWTKWTRHIKTDLTREKFIFWFKYDPILFPMVPLTRLYHACMWWLCASKQRNIWTNRKYEDYVYGKIPLVQEYLIKIKNII